MNRDANTDIPVCIVSGPDDAIALMAMAGSDQPMTGWPATVRPPLLRALKSWLQGPDERPGAQWPSPSTMTIHQLASRIDLSLARSLRLARRMAGAMNGAISVANPDG